MPPRLYMQSFQYANYDYEKEQIAFETRHANGARTYFLLTRNQFLSLNDAIDLIDKEQASGHFPLGHHTWIHYNGFEASLYRETRRRGRIYFTFECYEEYINFTHSRLLSIVRLNDAAAAANRGRLGRGRARGKPSNHKRPSSVVFSSKDQSPSPKRACRGKRKTVSGSSNNALLSDNEEESAVFSEWYCSNTRRRSDSIASISSVSKGIPSPEIVQLNSSFSSSYTMETE